MNKILIFAGTTEGRQLSECLCEAGIEHTLSVATEYGEIVLKKHPCVKVHLGRMNQHAIQEFMLHNQFQIVVDATHPYATAVTQNIKSAISEIECKGLKISYFRLVREKSEKTEYEKLRVFQNHEECVKALEQIDGNILLTTGSKELAVYCMKEDIRNRLFVRVLPGMESLAICMEQGICGKQILALQGPFSKDMNEAILRQYKIACLVTKQSGKTGGYAEKIEAAKNLDIPVFVIGQKMEETGFSFFEVCKKIEEILGKKIIRKNVYEITLAGIGMGNSSNLTAEAKNMIEQADILFGAKRLIANYEPRMEKRPIYLAEDIITYLKQLKRKNFMEDKIKVGILFSGDSGFYSGCQTVYAALQKEMNEGGLSGTVRIMPGISSVSFLCSCIGESYQDAFICSIHGKEFPNLADKIRHEKKTIVLMSGLADMKRLGRLLIDSDLRECQISAGYQLSYPEQQILSLTPYQCTELEEDGLYICLIKNQNARSKKVTHSKSDSEFIRDRIPMTKEEVREVSICKLKLRQDSVVYDIGSGTGSIAVEIAGLSEKIQVFAIEKREQAIALIKQNKEKFHLENIKPICATAPDGFQDLPMPTHAFIGGSSGHLKEILYALYQKNPTMRVVINAISLETICEIKEVLSLFSIVDEEVVQIQVSRVKSVEEYHLMQAENPVMICSFSFTGKDN